MIQQTTNSIFPFDRLPAELQVKILHALDKSTLAIACRLNKKISAVATPLFWEKLDLKLISDDYPSWDTEELLRELLITCWDLKQKQPDRWRLLAKFVRVFRVWKIPGLAIPFATHDYNDSNWHFDVAPDHEGYATGATVYDVIADFGNLQELDLYSKATFNYDTRADELAEKMRHALPHLKSLRIGGEVTMEMMHALLSDRNKIEDLACIGLTDGTAGQDYHSRGLLVLSSLGHGFPHLKSLHLCKLAQLSEVEDDKGMPWDWDSSDDYDMLEDWAAFLKKISDTLMFLTLEDRYLVAGNRFDSWKIINPGDRWKSNREREDTEESDDDQEQAHAPHPIEWGSASRARFSERLLPVLAEQAWPKLEKLVLIGYGLPDEDGKDTVLNSLKQLQPRVKVESRPAGTISYNYDATPLAVSPAVSLEY